MVNFLMSMMTRFRASSEMITPTMTDTKTKSQGTLQTRTTIKTTKSSISRTLTQEMTCLTTCRMSKEARNSEEKLFQSAERITTKGIPGQNHL